jgi:hypothetical protein
MADAIVFDEALSSEVSMSDFVSKDWLYCNDNNNSSYSSQVVLDTTSLSNSGAYLNWSEGFILMPLMLQIESTGAALTATSASDFIACLKSGYWNMLHSLTCEFNSNSVIQQVPFLNVFCGFKNITSWSHEDLKNWSDVCGFRPCSSQSWAYLDVAPANTLLLAGSGSGLTNNRNAPVVSIEVLLDAISTYTDPGGGGPITVTTAIRSLVLNTSTIATRASSDLRSAWNESMFERHKALNYNPVLTADNVYSSNQGLLQSGINCSSIFRTYSVAGADVRYYAIDAVIKLKHVADFFDKCPLIKGGTMRIYLNTNQCYFQVTQTSGVYSTTPATYGNIFAHPIMSLTASPVILGGGGTNPVQFASGALGQGASVLAPYTGGANAAAAVVAVTNVSCSIVRTQFSQMAGTYSCPITSVRLYVPAYTMSPLSEQRLLAMAPQKRIVYNDIFQFSFPNQSTNSPFNILVTNGIPNIRSVLVLPLLPAASNGTAAGGAVRSSSILSPFCSTPSAPDPIIIQNFQIQLSGKNLFMNQLQYDFEDFVEQLVSSNQLNGSLTTGLASGLVSKRDFQSLYRYYYGNCTRSLPSEQGVSKSVQIQGTILSPLATSVDIMVFVEFEKSISVDIRTGAVVGL